METLIRSFSAACARSLETFLVEWKPMMVDAETAEAINLETFLVEWKRKLADLAMSEPFYLETFLVEWKQTVVIFLHRGFQALKPS